MRDDGSERRREWAADCHHLRGWSQSGRLCADLIACCIVWLLPRQLAVHILLGRLDNVGRWGPTDSSRSSTDPFCRTFITIKSSLHPAALISHPSHPCNHQKEGDRLEERECCPRYPFNEALSGQVIYSLKSDQSPIFTYAHTKLIARQYCKGWLVQLEVG